MRKPSWFNSSLFVRFVLSYCAVLIIPVVIIGVVLNFTCSMLYQDTMDSNQKLLDQTRSTIDQHITDLSRLTTQLAQDKTFSWLTNGYGPVDEIDTYTLLENLERLQTYTISADYIAGLYLIIPERDLVLTPNSTYKLSTFYGTAFQYANLSEQEWEADYIQKYTYHKVLPSAPVMVNGSAYPAIMFVSSVSLQPVSSSHSTLMILISTSNFLQPLDGINTQYGGNGFILDGKGLVIAARSSKSDAVSSSVRSLIQSKKSMQGNFDAHDLLVSFAKSDVNDWTYVAESPANAVLARVRRVQLWTLLSISMAVVLGCVLSFLLSYSNVKPLREIVRFIPLQLGIRPSDSQNEYNYIRSSFDQMIADDHVLREKIRQHLPLARVEFLRRFMAGELVTDEEVRSNMQQVDMDITGACYNVMVARIQGYYRQYQPEALRELNALKMIVKNAFSEQDQQALRTYPVDINESTIAFILSFQQAEKPAEGLQKLIDNIRESLGSKYKISLKIAVGDFYHDMTDVCYAFSKANYALENGRNDEVIWYSSFSEETGFYYYPVDTESRLVNMIRGGNCTEVKKLMDMIYHENIKKGNISQDKAQNLISEIKGTILKVTFQDSKLNAASLRSINRSLARLTSCTRFEDAYQLLADICMLLSQKYEQGKVGHVNDMQNSILQFVENNYRDPQFSLGFVASRFKMSDTNLSHFFKDQIGQNFSDYVEKLRIDKACELISRCDISMDEIAENVGYASANSFRRAFKRCKGSLPSDYRHNQTN